MNRKVIEAKAVVMLKRLIELGTMVKDKLPLTDWLCIGLVVLLVVLLIAAPSS